MIENEKIRLGIDAGSNFIGIVVLKGAKISHSSYLEHKGNLLEVLGSEIHVIQEKLGQRADCWGITGSAAPAGTKILPTVLSLVEAGKFLLPDVRNIIYIGAQRFVLVRLDTEGKYLGHTMNSECASGTGSFIEQQAKRLGLTACELSDMAFSFKGKIPNIATRCAVFAKSDIIHSQQQGYSVPSICAGLSMGIARGVLDVVLKGEKLEGKTMFLGGVSKNRAVARDLAALAGCDLLIPMYSEVAGAIGAALHGDVSHELLQAIFINHANESQEHGRTCSGSDQPVRQKVAFKLANYPKTFGKIRIMEDDVEILVYNEPAKGTVPVYLGIDIGSTSTKLVVADLKGAALAGFYTQTAGAPLQTTFRLLKMVENFSRYYEGVKFDIRGVGTTGSGRKMVGGLIGADLVINEITAHARAAFELDREVDTIIEIGGQDSKFTRMQNGIVTDSTMNYVCAAGTGSFIEEQAKKLGMTLEEFSNLDIKNTNAPFTSDRCTVYMERDLNLLLNQAWEKNSLALAVLYSVRDNYISRVAGTRASLGNKIYFQGATARNRALVAVFEDLLGRSIFVSDLCHLTGAYGVALLMADAKVENTKFLGFDSSSVMEEEICQYCINRCSLSVIRMGGGSTLAWGMKCGRDYEVKSKKSGDKKEILLPSGVYKKLFSRVKADAPFRKQVIGIPDFLYMIEYHSLWTDFFSSLGFQTISAKPGREHLSKGKSLVHAEFCAPIILAHGQFEELCSMNPDFIFFPAMINEQDFEQNRKTEKFQVHKTRDALFCYYSEFLPTILKMLPQREEGLRGKILSPVLYFGSSTHDEILHRLFECIGEALSLSLDEISGSFEAAFSRFKLKRDELKHLAKSTAKTDLSNRRSLSYPNPLWKAAASQHSKQFSIVLFGRPYTLYDDTLNLGIPEKLQKLGYDVYTQDMFEPDSCKNEYSEKYLEKMHWNFGQKILMAAGQIAVSRDYFPIYLTCFRCSPDSFVIGYFKDIMEKHGKPYLVMQLDEHAQEAGYVTRIEAALESFTNAYKKTGTSPESPKKLLSEKTTQIFSKQKAEFDKRKNILIPYIDNIIGRLIERSFKSAGYGAIHLDIDKEMLALGYKHASGGECMPAVAILGSVIAGMKKFDLDPFNTALYLPVTCLGCNFFQFPVLIESVMQRIGYDGFIVPFVSSLKPVKDFSKELNVKILECNITGSLLHKLYARYKPYETSSGETDDLLETCIAILFEDIDKGASLRKSLRKIAELFKTLRARLPQNLKRLPLVALLGDLYIKYNPLINQDLIKMVINNGCELILPSITESTLQIMDADTYQHGFDSKFLRGARMFERRYEMIVAELLDEHIEPDIESCRHALLSYGIDHYLPGETSLNLGRALYYLDNKMLDAIIHVNPIFCCPGVVSSSIFRKIQKDYSIPVIDIFYDGTGNPNQTVVPHLHYLRANKNPQVVF